MRLPAPVGFALLTLLAAGSWWLARRDEAPPEPATTVAQPGYYLRAADLEQTDGTGRINLRLHAAVALQSRPGGDVNARDLVADYLPDAAHDWHMTATSGTLPADSQTVLLAGDVRLRAPEKGAPLARTEHLRFDLATELATTGDPVRIEMPPHVINARGMRADMKRETLRLESSVNGTFAR